jgi:Uma2 family endonuclease
MRRVKLVSYALTERILISKPILRRHASTMNLGSRQLNDPFLIVEILSPSTERHDRRIKLPVYRQIESVQEIVLIASDGLYGELHRRSGAHWITDILRGGEARLVLTSVGLEIPLADLYEGIALPEPED